MALMSSSVRVCVLRLKHVCRHKTLVHTFISCVRQMQAQFVGEMNHKHPP